MSENGKITIDSYAKVWNIENKIYAIQNIVLPVPIKPIELGYFILIAGVMFILNAVVGFVAVIPFILKYIVIPYGLTQFLLRIKLDGKKPQRFLSGYVKHIFAGGQAVERFKPGSYKESKYRLEWDCSKA